MKKSSLRCALFCAAVSMSFLQSRICAGDEAPAATKAFEAEQLIFDSVTDAGILFLNNEGLVPPYHVVATAESVFVNDVALSIVASEAPLERPEYRRERPRSNFQGPGRRDFPPPNRQRGPRRGSNRPASLRIAESIHTALENDMIVVAFDDQNPVSIGQASNEVVFIETMFSSSPEPEAMGTFLAFEPVAEQREKFGSLLQNSKIPGELREIMSQRVENILAIERESLAQMQASLQLDRLAYPLTIVGIILGVIAFGHMLKWSARGITAQQDSETSLEVDRFVVVAIRLMLAMSALDLTWTILAGQAGAMKEVNPFAADLISSPLQLAIFKVIATGIGLGIVYMWRQRQQMQQAAWWICLIFVLLTFRWVMFDSMMT